jgi:hypothetical protein
MGNFEDAVKKIRAQRAMKPEETAALSHYG